MRVREFLVDKKKETRGYSEIPIARRLMSVAHICIKAAIRPTKRHGVFLGRILAAAV